jgi:hypothetical protein
MAKKPRKGAAPEAEGEEGAAAEKPKGGKKKLLLLAGALGFKRNT